MGGGMQMLTGNVTSTPGDPVDQDTCIREDGLDLYQQWQVPGVAGTSSIGYQL